MLINGREEVGIENLQNPKTLIIHENLMMFMKIWKIIIQQRKRVLIVFDMIVDTEFNKKLGPKVTELLLRGRKLNIPLVFISQSFFKVPKTIRLNAKHYFIMKIPNK